MSNTIVFKFQKSQLRKKGEGGKTLYSAVASTDALDRDREVLLPKGVITDNFMTNPVMLYIHNYRQLPVGRVHQITVSDGDIKFDFEFADTEEAKSLEKLYNTNFMNAFSVGFYPKSAFHIDEETPEKFELEVADGSKVNFDLTKYTERPRAVVNKWELLEISPVPVPSNPEALLIRAKDEIIRKTVGAAGVKSAVGQLLDEQLSEKLKSLTTELKDFMHSLDNPTEEVVVDSVVGYHETPIKMDQSWDSVAARGSLARWASSNGSGDKDTINWGKYAKGFAWVDTKNAGSFGAYKLPHHTISEGELVGVWKGVTSAMATLLSAKGGETIPEADRPAVYQHLAKHYKAVDKEPPEFGKEYTEEELKAIEEDSKLPELPEDSSDVADDEPGDDSTQLDAVRTLVNERFDELKGMLAELEEVTSIRSNILVEMLMELQEKVVKFVESKTESEPDIDTGGDDEDLKEIESQFASVNEFLRGLSESTKV